MEEDEEIERRGKEGRVRERIVPCKKKYRQKLGGNSGRVRVTWGGGGGGGGDMGRIRRKRGKREKGEIGS